MEQTTICSARRLQKRQFLAHMEEEMRGEHKAEHGLVNEGGRNPRSLSGVGWQRSDAQLVVAARAGDLGAMDELFGRYQKMLHRFAYRFVADPDEAADLVQETMLRAIRNFGSFRGECRFTSWMIAILVNRALEAKRKEGRICWVRLNEEKPGETLIRTATLRDPRRNPEEDYSQRELRVRLRQGILRLRPKHRFMLQACVLDELPIEQAAGALGITLGAAKSNLYRAKQQLSDAMKRRGVTGTNIRTAQRTMVPIVAFRDIPV